MAVKDSFCGHCGETASDHCKGCMNMTYCSVECQQADWQFHKHLCKHWATAKVSPGPDMRLTIMLPEHSTKPIFKWLHVPEGSDDLAAEELASNRPSDDDDDDEGDDSDDIEFREDLGVPVCDRVEGMVFPDIAKTFGADAPAPHFIDLVCGKMGSGELLNHSIHLWVSDTFTSTIGPNKCLANLIDREIASRYHGPLYFVAMTKVDQPSWTLNLDTRDLTVALDGLVEYNKRVLLQHTYDLLPKQPKKLKGLKVNIAEPFFEEGVKIPVRHPIFKAGGNSLPLMAKLQLPIRMFKYRASRTTPTPSINTLESSTHINLLHINVDPVAHDFGTASARFHDADGASILLAQEDVDFTKQHLIDLVAFLEKFIKPQVNEMRAMPMVNRLIAWQRFMSKWENSEAMAEAGLL